MFTPAPQFEAPEISLTETEWRRTLPGPKAMVNVGSVGQPRDLDSRASYIILETGAPAADVVVRFRRIRYPSDITCKKIYAVADLDNYLGDRLLVGR